jgi:hypothetical protein
MAAVSLQYFQGEMGFPKMQVPQNGCSYPVRQFIFRVFLGSFEDFLTQRDLVRVRHEQHLKSEDGT